MAIQIKRDILDKMKKDDDIIYSIAKASRVKFRTVLGWLDQNHPAHRTLTTEENQVIIRKGLGLSKDASITEKKKEPKAVVITA